jgi:hypothetical protein
VRGRFFPIEKKFFGGGAADFWWWRGNVGAVDFL